MLITRRNKFISLKILLVAALLAGAGCMHVFSPETQPPEIEGIFWQADRETTPPSGNWDLLGVNTFVPQWSVVQSQAWFDHEMGIPKWDKNINLAQLQQHNWAQHIILGLAGEYDERKARSHIHQLAEQSQQIINTTQHVPLKGYYFPIEADPSWLGVGVLAHALRNLPRPLWISIYSAEQYPEHLAMWLKSWLPDNTHVFFQDGVGVGTRSPKQARAILDDLQREFGQENIVIVLEAFRPTRNGFRSAYPWEIISQLKAYEGQKVYIFDGPHYMNRFNVYTVALWYRLYYGSPHKTAA